MRIKRWWAGYLATVLVLAACAQPDSSDEPDAPAAPQSLIPVLSPCPGIGGPTLVFSATHSAGASVDVYGVSPTGTVEPLTDDGKSSWPGFHPNGTSLIFARAATRAGSAGGPPPATSIWSMDLEGGNQQLLAEAVEVRHPSISPDGTQIAFAGTVDTDEIEWGSRVQVLTVDGQRPRRMTEGPRSDLLFVSELEPVWSPDGQSLAFIRVGDRGEDSLWQIWTIALTSGQQVLRLESPNAGVGLLSWTADGEGLLFTARPSSGRGLAARLLGLTTGDVQTIAEPVGAIGAFGPDAELIYLNLPDSGGALTLTIGTDKTSPSVALTDASVVPASPVAVAPCKGA